MYEKSTPGVGQYNLAESSDSSSAYRRNPHFSFGNQRRQTVDIRSGPSPLDYNPRAILKRAHVDIMSQAERFGSAKLTRSRTEQALAEQK